YVNVYWENEIRDTFQATLELVCNDRTGLLADVTIALSSMRIFIHSLNSREIQNAQAVVTATIDVSGKEHLESIINRLRSIRGVISIDRY
ncbi:MAG: ACT domain-containing protein, partial [Ruminococcus sp.]